MSIFFSSCAFRGAGPEEILEEIRSLDGVGLEFTAGQAPREDWATVLPLWKNAGTDILLHNYFPPPSRPFVLNLAARDPSIRHASLELCRTALELSAMIGAPFFSVHSGFAIDMRPDQIGNHEAQAREAAASFDPAEAMEYFVENVSMLAREAERLKVRLLLENNVVSESHRRAGMAEALLLSSPSQIRSAMIRFSGLPVGLLLDVAHAKVAAQTLDFAADDFFALEMIEALHLSDNDGQRDSNSPFTVESWFMPHLPAHRDKAVVIEVACADSSIREGQLAVLRNVLN